MVDDRSVREEQTVHRRSAGNVSTLTLHFCDEVSRSAAAKFAVERVSLPGADVRTPHVSSFRTSSPPPSPVARLALLPLARDGGL